MPFNGSPPSPALGKMEGNGGRLAFRRRRRCSFGNIIGDPFALATISISILAWLLAFVSSILAALDTAFPKFAWWTIVFMLFCIVGVTITIAADAVFTYHVAIVGYLSAGIILTTSATNQLIYSAQGASEAAAAGFILLTIVSIVWIFYFGSQPQASHRSYVDSFALHKGDRPSAHMSRQMSNRFVDQQQPYAAGPPSQMYTSNHLNGLETSSPSYPGGTLNSSVSQQARFGGSVAQPSQIPENSQAQLDAPATEEGEVAAPAEYKYRAKAIYSYEANPDDANEISFSKTEILEISDVTGRWWQARKANGETGIAPSNYLILL